MLRSTPAPFGPATWRKALLGLTTVALCGCVTTRPTTAPIRQVAWPATAPAGSRLMVFLPGMGATPEEFETRGFTAAVRATDPSIDLLAVDAHFGYYREEILNERMWQDVLLPAVQSGYSEIWLVGTSMGGLGALELARNYTDSITGLVLLAPYLGPAGTIQEIEAAGGLASWTPADHEIWHYRLWRWLKGYAGESERPKVILAFGDRDRLSAANEILGAVLPTDQVLRGEGGHGWRVWAPLWEEILQRSFQVGQQTNLQERTPQ